MQIGMPLPAHFPTSRRRRDTIFTLALLLVGASAAPGVDVGHAAVRPGTLPGHWITGGPKGMEGPAWQVHGHTPDFYLLAESRVPPLRKPFLVRCFGTEKGLV